MAVSNQRGRHVSVMMSVSRDLGASHLVPPVAGVKKSFLIHIFRIDVEKWGKILKAMLI